MRENFFEMLAERLNFQREKRTLAGGNNRLNFVYEKDRRSRGSYLIHGTLVEEKLSSSII